VTLPGGWELVLVVLVIMVLFGAKRLPDASRSLGRSLRIFKAETKGLRDDDTPPSTTTAYDAREHDRQVYDRTVGTPPPVPPVPGVPPVANGESTDPAQPRQP
jgi:sec-independent protein translocase protein TatA